jgi:hypothetical protein
MKTNKIILILTLVVSVFGFNSCSPEDDIKNPDFQPLIMNEDFARGFVDNTTLTSSGWINYNEAGTAKYKWQEYQHNAYAEFTSFQSGDATNIAWLISPAIDLSKQSGEKLTFESAQSYVTSSSNSLEALISTDFDGTNVTAATWQTLPANLPTTSSVYFAFLPSGVIDLSSYTGKAYIAFKVKGSGTNTALDGSYQIDNVKVFN